MVKTLQRPDGQIAYDDTEGTGRTVVFVPGMGDLRQSTRLITPLLSHAGYRVITVDIRGHGESSTTFTDYRASAVGSDIVALLTQLDIRDVTVVGNSMASGSAVWAAAECPDRIAALVLVGPFVRDIPMNAVVKSLINVMLWNPWGVGFWGFFYKTLFKTNKPADLAEYTAALTPTLREPGRLSALQQMMAASKADCEARIGEVHKPVVVVMGTVDPDFTNPAVEAAHVAKLLNGKVEMIEGAGHYPHVEYPEKVAEIIRTLV